MSGQFEVDQFTTEQSWHEFLGRYAAIDQAIDVLGLRGVNPTEDPALLFGGGALARCFLDSYIEGDKPADLDIVVSRDMYSRLGQFGLRGVPFKQHGLHGVIRARGRVPLKLDVITSEDPSELSVLLGDEPYTGEMNNSVMDLDGVRLLLPSVVTYQKVRYTGARMKDLAGVIKAHVVATHRQHGLADEESWQAPVSYAVDRLLHGRLETSFWRKKTGKGPKYPSWLSELIAADFDHPAFADIKRVDKKEPLE